MSSSQRDGLSEEEVERRAQTIIATSIAQARAETPTDWITTEDMDVMWIACEKRSAAIRQFLSETDSWHLAKDVAVRREWLWIDTDAIEELAHDMAADRWRDEEEIVTDVAYTWEGESFLWTKCKRTDEGALPFWRCELKDGA